MPLLRALLFVAIAAVFTPTEAVACEAGYCVTSTVPADAAVDVPTDTQIFVFFNSTPGFTEPQGGMALVEAATQQGLLTTIEVFDGFNPNVEVGNYVVVVKPLVPLLPDTEYELTFGAGSVCGAASLSFTTGTETAAEATFAGATAVTASCVAPPDEITSCDDGDAFPRVLYTLESGDATDAAAFVVYRKGQTEPRAIVPATTPVAVELLPQEIDATEECFTLKAVSASGAEVGDAEVCLASDLECEEPSGDDVGVPDVGVPDAGPDQDIGSGAPDVGPGTPDIGNAAPDLGAPAPDTGDPLDGVVGGGCSCATTPAADASLAALLLGFVAARLRRRRE